MLSPLYTKDKDKKMSITVESVTVQTRPGTTGNAGSVGTTVFTADVTGVKAVSPSKLMQDANVIHDKLTLTSELLAGSVDKHIWVCNEGRWQVAGVAEIHTVVGGAAAQDRKSVV